MTSEFDTYFINLFKDRWQSIKMGLQHAPVKLAVSNTFLPRSDNPLGVFEIEEKYFEHYKSTTLWEAFKHYGDFLSTSWSMPIESEQGILRNYIMDIGSFLVAKEVGTGERILDLCSAPGGKGIFVYRESYLNNSLKEFVFNEPSRKRRESLKGNLRAYIPEDSRAAIKVKGLSGHLIGKKYIDYFDKILVDAPCSGERYLVSERRINQWSEKQSRRLAKNQIRFLLASELALKKGGHLIYSTCSINPIENDQVIETVLKKRKSLSMEPFEFINNDWGEPTEFGMIFMPDQLGFGPIYVSKLKKCHFEE